MTVLDSFPFEDADAQFSDRVRHSARVSTGHLKSGKIRNDSPGAAEEDLGTQSSCLSNTVRENLEVIEQTGLSHGSVEEMEHSGAETSEGFLKCRLCSYQTKIRALLQWHVKKHSMDSSFQCPACDFRETDATIFVEHIRTHQSGKMVRCCFCPRKMFRGKLRDHMRVHRSVELYDCSMCQFSTNYVQSIKCHVDVYHTKKHSCQQCGQAMTKHELLWHMKSGHSAAPVEDLPEEIIPSPEPASCGTGREAPKQPGRVLPNQSILSRKPGTSKISKKVTIAQKSLKNLSPKKPYNCGKCEYKTFFKKLLRSHRAKHLLDNSLVCSKCGFKETSCAQFTAHLLSHSQSNLIECCFCGFQSQVKKTMSDHVRKYRPISMFDCSECEFSAKRPASLRSHMKRLHGKRLRCKSCGLKMSEFAMVSHKKECTPEVPGSGAGPSLVTLENPLSETDMEAELCLAGGDAQPDKNTVPCEFCRKPFAKSYIRKHGRKCVENASDLASRNKGDINATLPDPSPSSCDPASGEVSVGGVINIQPAIDNTQPGAFVFDLLDPETFGLGKYCVVLKKLNLDALQLNSGRESTTNENPELADQTLNFKRQNGCKTTKPVLRCSACSYTTKKRQLLKKHVVKHLEDTRLQCPHCGLKEMSSYTFARHKHRHQDDKKRPKCCFCDSMSFSSKHGLARHLEKHRPVIFIDCSKCEFSTYRSDLLKNHIERQHRKKYLCRVVGDNVSQFRHMANSSSPVKTSETNQLKSSLNAGQSFVNHCKSKPVCETSLCVQSITNSPILIPKDSSEILVQPKDLVFDRSAINRPSLDENIDSGRLSAENCVFKIPINSQANLPPSAMQQPLPTKSPEKLVKPYLYCSKCSFVTRIKSLLKRHVAKHLLDVRLTCTKCDFKASSTWTFSRHWFSHNADRARMISCCFCTAQFKKETCLKSSLPHHLEGHQVFDLFDCPKCEFSCKRKKTLQAHYQKLHVNQHYCEACGKFMRLKRLFNHACKRTGLKEPCGPVHGFERSGTSKEVVDKLSTGEDVEIDQNLESFPISKPRNVLASEGLPVEAHEGTLSSVDMCSSMLAANLGLNDAEALCTLCKSLVPSSVLASHQLLCCPKVTIVDRPTNSASPSAMNMGNMHHEAIILQEQEIRPIEPPHDGYHNLEPQDSASYSEDDGLPGGAWDLSVTGTGSKPPTQPHFTRETKFINISSDSADSYGSSYADSELNRVENPPQLSFENLIQDRIMRMFEIPRLNELPKLHNTSSGNFISLEHPYSVSLSSPIGPSVANAPQSSSGNQSSF